MSALRCSAARFVVDLLFPFQRSTSRTVFLENFHGAGHFAEFVAAPDAGNVGRQNRCGQAPPSRTSIARSAATIPLNSDPQRGSKAQKQDRCPPEIQTMRIAKLASSVRPSEIFSRAGDETVDHLDLVPLIASSAGGTLFGFEPLRGFEIFPQACLSSPHT